MTPIPCWHRNITKKIKTMALCDCDVYPTFGSMLLPWEQIPAIWRSLYWEPFSFLIYLNYIIHDHAWLICLLQSHLHHTPSCDPQEFPQQASLAGFHGVAPILSWTCQCSIPRVFHSAKINQIGSSTLPNNHLLSLAMYLWQEEFCLIIFTPVSGRWQRAP